MIWEDAEVVLFIYQPLYRGTVMSSYKKQKIGIHQGAVTSPTHFNIMVNGLPSSLNNISGIRTALYVDDLVILIITA